jgi:hypothetical protein
VVTVGAVLAGGLTVAAITEDGYRSDHVTLHDGAVWVTKQDQTLGRFNYDLQLVDTASETFDPIREIHQIDSTVIVETSSGKAFAYNVAMNRAEGAGAALPPESSLSIGGENGALLDVETGKVWYTDRSGIASVVYEGPQETPGSLEIEGAERVHVGSEGTLFAIGPAAGTIWRVGAPVGLSSFAPTAAVDGEAVDAVPGTAVPGTLPTGSMPAATVNALAEIEEVALPGDLGDGEYQSTTAGDELVLLSGNSLILGDGRELPLPAEVGDRPVLQQPSDDSTRVLVASTTGLVAISLSDGAAEVVSEVDDTEPLQPVWLNGCAYAAWSTTVVATCSSPTVVEVSPQPGATFRSNRNRVVLNFADGSLLAFPEGEAMVSVDNSWSSALDPNDEDEETEEDQQVETENKCELATTNSAPSVPSSPTFTVRAGQSSTIDVLNPPGAEAPASDPDCDVLTVAVDPEVPLDPELGTLAVVNAGRSFQLQPLIDQGSMTISYLVSDGSTDGTVRATADVTVIGVEDEGREPIASRDSTTVEVGKTAVVDVLANDADPDGDAISVKAVEVPAAGDGTLVWQPSGRIAYTAPGSGAGTKTIEYTVADDRGLQTVGELEISVISQGVTTPPNPRSDAVLGMVDAARGAQTFAVNVLENDSDPNGDELRVTEIVGYPASDGPNAAFDADGVVSLTTTEPGSYNFEYTVADVQGETATSRVRFEILPDAGRQPPVAVRDSVVVTSVRPTVVDVLRNDTDLNGDVLMVTGVDLPDATAEDLNVEVIDGRFVRISTRRSQPTQTAYQFSYTASDGEQQASTTVAVGIIPSGGSQPPVTMDDRGEVHLGGYLGIPVLANDFDPNGIPLTLVSAVLDDKVAAQGAPGATFVQGNQIRYVPPTPEARPSPFTATGTYTVTNGRDTTNGRFTIQVTDPAQNRPPNPAPIELRTFAGQPVSFDLPSFGLDPDGDPVELVSLDGPPPRKGVVDTAATGAAFTYTPLPGLTGSDSMRWQLRDRYDAVGYLDVRIVISAPASGNRPPVAVRDEAQVALGQTVFIPVLANDTDPDPGNIVTFVADRPFDQPNDGAGQVTGVTDDGFIGYDAPNAAGEYSFLYYITDSDGLSAEGLSPPVQGLVTVTVTTADQIVNRPPVVSDVVLKPARDGEVVTVDLAEYASDPEGQPLAFRPGADAELLGATISGSELTVQMTRDPLIFTFLADDGAESDFLSTGVVQIPVPKNRAPIAEIIELELGEEEFTKEIEIPASTFSDPDGDDVTIYVDSDPRVSPPEASNGGDMKWDGDSFVFNRNPDFGGVAKIDYSIVDSPPDGVGAPIIQPASVVLQIKKASNEPPTIRQEQIDVVSGSTSSFDLLSLVTDPDPGDLAVLEISDVEWNGPSKVEISTSGTRVTFTADIDAAEVGEVVPAEVSFVVDDGREAGRVEGSLIVNVRPTTLGAPVAVDDLFPPVKQGESPTWNLLRNDPPNGTGQGGESDYEIVSVTQPALGTVTISGTDSVSFVPTPEASGQTDFQYTIEDRARRQATATVRLAVHDRPAVPTQPTVGEQLSATAVVAFGRPADNGSPITSYEVRGAPGGSATCTGSPCTVSGLSNGVEYSFQVRALNEVGWSEWSPSSAPYTPDELPGTPPIAQADWNDRSATVTWGAIPNEGSEIIDVTVRITPATGAGAIVVAGGQRGGTATFTGLTNGTAYSFTLVARNRNGDSPPSAPSTAVVPAGLPSFAAAPTFIADNGFVDVSWAPANGNGDDDLTYTVKLTDVTGGTTTPYSVGATLSSRLPAENGRTYNAVVNVSNKYTTRFSPAGVDSPPSASATAIGIPTAPPSVTATAGAGNGAIQLTWGAAGAAGGTISGYQVSTNGGPWTNVGNTTSTTFSSGLSLGAAYSFSVRALNNNRAGVPGTASAPSNTARPYTPPAIPNVGCSNNGGTEITCTWSPNALNGPAPQSVTVSGATSSSSASGTWASGNIGNSQTRSITVRVCNGGTSGNNCSQASAAATTVPPPAPTLTLGRAPRAGGGQWVTGSGSNWTPGAQYWIRCFDGIDGTFVNTQTNTPVVYQARYVDPNGNLSWGNGICWSTVPGSVEVWTSSGQSVVRNF